MSRSDDGIGPPFQQLVSLAPRRSHETLQKIPGLQAVAIDVVDMHLCHAWLTA